jgi:hypothetical protein
MPKRYEGLNRLSPAQFAAVMAYTLLVTSDYLQELGGYAAGARSDWPEELTHAVAAEVRRRGLEQLYREAYLEEADGMAAPVQSDELVVGDVVVELTGLAMMRQRWILKIVAPLSRSEAAALARESAGDHVWDYEGMVEGTIEVEVAG